jgi:hypothetical protein
VLSSLLHTSDAIAISTPVHSLRQQGTLRYLLPVFAPQGKNRQQKDSSYRSAEG